MSRLLPLVCVSVSGFPRVSGDEPAAMDANPIGLMFSPRERG